MQQPVRASRLSALLLLLSSLQLAAASRPGNPPQCYEPHLCITTFNVGGTFYWVDLSSLCQQPGAEYTAWGSGITPNPSTYPQVIFNVCGTVQRDIAPYKAENTGANVILPFPASHGVVMQLIDDPTVGPGAGQTCADVDTCDQDTNPTCQIGSLNYDATRTGVNPFTTQPIAHNPAREAVCAGNPSYDYCVVQQVVCTENAEVLARYTAGENTLGDALDVKLNDPADPQSGVNLTWANLPAFTSDPFVCSVIDPTTGNVVPRSVNLFIACDETASSLIVDSFSEPQQCAYYITARAAAACATTNNPFVPSPSGTPTPTAAPTATPSRTHTRQPVVVLSPTALATPRVVAAAAPGTNFGYTLLGALIVAPAAIFLTAVANNRGWLERPKALAPSWLLAAPGWLASGGDLGAAGGKGGGGGGGAGGYTPVGSSSAAYSKSSSGGDGGSGLAPVAAATSYNA